MTFGSGGDSVVASRLALEALRSGVPNRSAVRLLGCNQPRVEKQFAELLEKAADAEEPAQGAQGMLVSGDFGSGKSHLLAHLEHLALEQNFVCSKVAISKETPLYDLGKVFISAMENGRLPDRSGRLIEELGQALKPDSREFAKFFQWADQAAKEDDISLIFPASLLVYERSGDFDLNNDIESFWAGDRILKSRITTGLRQIDQLQNYKFRMPRPADLPPQRLRFALELIKGARYRGWVVLLDEIELVGSYSLLQRGRSYAEVARWMGRAAGEPYPGLVVVGSVTDDFASAIISPDGMRKDHDYIRPKLEANPRYNGIAGRAETGMRLLERSCIPLQPPSKEDVSAAVEGLRSLYSEAYGWNAPPIEERAGGASIYGRMRYQVRRAINEWDLLRLRPDSSPDTEFQEFTPSYEENRDLEAPAEEGAEG
ncbi:MAG: DUF2791 family P-loop domain-containing protein [Caldilineaceae bacterium]|nr:DUF2791 family P-loop domain-containing protein [Caldilineaceae bacterium]